MGPREGGRGDASEQAPDLGVERIDHGHEVRPCVRSWRPLQRALVEPRGRRVKGGVAGVKGGDHEPGVVIEVDDGLEGVIDHGARRVPATT